jgi:multiple sugar transport system substrate-binding protein
MSARHLGLTWDHPRGFNALAAAERGIAPAGLIHWEKQPLEGFESHPIGELAARYDLLVLDHPHIGEAVALDCLVPLEDVFSAAEIAAWGAASVGATMASYRWRGAHWALPLDVATQVLAYRGDLVAAPPRTWGEVLALSETVPVALSVAGPHAALNFHSLCIALGEPPGGGDLVDDEVATEALDVLSRLHRRAPAGTTTMNPIGLLDTMAKTDSIACVPLVYGYVNYAAPGDGAHRVSFADAPTGPGGERGSVLGGTGLALTRRARPDAALLDHLRWLLSADAQCCFIPAHDGQPSARRAWHDAEVNVRSGGFYRATLATTETAWVRPRHDGAILFQTDAAALVRRFLADAASATETIAALRSTWRRSHATILSEETAR